MPTDTPALRRITIKEDSMSKTKDGGQAFPRTVERWNSSYENADGMTLRDYFAANALSGMLIAAFDEGVRDELYAQAARRDLSPKQSVAVAAYEYADAMLRARDA
jgi:hypothetical protein